MTERDAGRAAGRQGWRSRALRTGLQRALLGGLAALGLTAVLVGCAQTVNPATGAREATALSAADEQRIGDAQHPQILRQFGGVYGNPRVGGYVAQIGGRLAANSELRRARWTFTVLDTDTVNAFALPGGYVYITRGLVAYANDEAQLAGVLGHEIGHITARHTAQRVTRARTASMIGVLAGLGAAAAGVDSGMVRSAVGLASRGVLASYSRDQELEADRLGIRYLNRAGYDTRGQADVLRQLARERGVRARLLGERASSGGFFATHPATPQRVRAAEAEARRASARGPAAARDARRRGRFLDQIDGMAYGDSGRQRIRVVTVQAGDTPQSLARRMAGGKLKLERFLALNGLETGARLRRGDRVKLVAAR